MEKLSNPPFEQHAISSKKLLSFFVPELITAAILYLVLDIINFRFIACTDVAMCNATVFVTNSLLTFITKIAEGFSIGVIILCGQYHGIHNYKKTGSLFADALWTTLCVGAIISCILYFGAHYIYAFYQVPPEISRLGVPYLRIRAIGVFFSFLYFTFVGFFRAIQDPKMPMIFFALGAATYLFFDYALIFGAWGFPELGLIGSAWASVIQFAVMLAAALAYTLLKGTLNEYHITFLSIPRLKNIRDIIHMSWPIMIDKASLALGPIWFTKMIGCTAQLATPQVGLMLFDSITVLKTTERITLLPAIACAQLMTYVVSNDYKIHHFSAIKKNIKKVVLFGLALVTANMCLVALYPQFFLGILGIHKGINEFTLTAIWLLAVLILFDVVQLILAAALRGAANVQFVMMIRIGMMAFFLIPGTYAIVYLPLDNIYVKFLLLYSAVHISKAIMGAFYVKRLKSGSWN